MQVSLNPLSFITVFFYGVLVSFSPCIYPFIPITLSYIGAKGSSSKIRGFYLSLVYAIGLAFAFSVLGTLAALSGKVFGTFTQSAYFYLLIANIYILLGLSLLGVINFPSKNIAFFGNMANKLSAARGLIGIFLLGLLSGVVVSPCAVAFLGAILASIAKERSIFLGISLLSCFALGMSSLLILAGTFGSILYSLPKSGLWNERLKKAGGLILIVGGEYFLITAGFLL
ncbi:MAG: sulfite exporter TauE/SafE family protein [Candidatus Omnitrophica bacterium]|nr:sulfite exporter TauE/SafE family protein [Candidatus Omnitrophota bacterium]